MIKIHFIHVCNSQVINKNIFKKETWKARSQLRVFAARTLVRFLAHTPGHSRAPTTAGPKDPTPSPATMGTCSHFHMRSQLQIKQNPKKKLFLTLISQLPPTSLLCISSVTFLSCSVPEPTQIMPHCC